MNQHKNTISFKHFLIVIIAFIIGSCSPSGDNSNNDPLRVSIKEKNKIIQDRYNVAILVMNGVYNTELIASYDVFQHTQYRENIKAMNIITVANTHELIRTFEGLYIKPDFDYTRDPMPHIDILVVPSAEHHLNEELKDTAMIRWVKDIGDQAMFITSHCDGTFVLAKAGLLEGVACTTFPGEVKTFKEMFPSLRVYADVTFVHDKNIITSAGGAKSYDAALYLIQLLYGKVVADKIARGLVIDWDLNSVKKVIVHQGNGFSTL
ncbi:MAG: DJ-1/PfpI family protein [Saprospiraceae bacterium]